MTSAVEPRFQLDTGKPGTLGVSGVLSFDTASLASRAIQSAWAPSIMVRLELPGVNQNNTAGANPAAPAAGAQTPNAGQKMPATASPLELIGLLGLGTRGVGAALRKPRLNA